MFVRWKRSPLKKKPGGDLLAASLVESVRVDGKPRQRTVAYLGSIAESDTQPGGRSVLVRCFWRAVRERLDALALDAATADAILVKLAERVPTAGNDAERDELAAIEARFMAAGVVPNVATQWHRS